MEPGLASWDFVEVVQMPIEAAFNDPFEAFTYTGCKRYWPKGLDDLVVFSLLEQRYYFRGLPVAWAVALLKKEVEEA